MRKLTVLGLCIALLVNEGCSDSAETTPAPSSSTTATKDTIVSDAQLSIEELAVLHLSCMVGLDFECNDSINGGTVVVFTPYTSFDSAAVQQLSFQDLSELHSRDTLLKWGEFDGTGDPIIMTVEQYFKRFVNDVNYLDPSIEINKGALAVRGSSISMLEQQFPDGEIIEFYSPPKNPELMGMDWRALIFVFQKLGDQMRLVAVAHNEWTI